MKDAQVTGSLLGGRPFDEEINLNKNKNKNNK